MEIKGVIFDVDGVIIHSEPVLRERRKQFFAENGESISEEIQLQLVGSNPKDMFQLIFPGEIEKQKIWLEKYEIFKKGYSMDFKKIVDPEIYGLVENLRLLQLKLGIASSGPEKSIRKMLKDTDLEDVFSCVVSGEMFEKSKPDPAVYLAAVEELGLHPNQCVAVEDSYYGTQSAKNAGLYVVGIKHDDYAIDFRFADVVVENLNKVIQVVMKEGNGKC